MKSSTGNYYAGLDHVRALAALLVFVWHFQQRPVFPDVSPLAFPLALFKEGHVGVALFMVLSGYLFAKLLDGRRVHFGRFLVNRALRLFPLLAVVIVVFGVQVSGSADDALAYVQRIASGFVMPRWPHGGWSIAVEMHFYLLLPALLWLLRSSALALAGVLVASIGLRYVIWSATGEVQTAAYWTIAGRIDQFVLGMLMWHWRGLVVGRHGVAACVATAFAAFYWWFAFVGGFYGMPSFPSPTALWIVLPTIEGAALAALLAWYDGSFRWRDAGMSAAIARVGMCSYSIYLLHMWFVEPAQVVLMALGFDVFHTYTAIAGGMIAFVAFVPVAWLSHRCIEAPFLRYRVRYLLDAPSVANLRGAVQAAR